MTDGVVQVAPNSTGAKIDTSELTVGSNTVERQRVVIADDATAAAIVHVETKGAQGTYALTTQDFKDSGRTVMTLFSNNVASVGTSEAMMSTTGTVLYRGGATVAGSSGSYTVTAGKTFRISAMVVVYTTGGATATGCQVRLRSLFSASQTISTSAPVIGIAVSCPATAAIMNSVSMPLQDGIEIASGTTFGLSQVSTTTATSNLVTVCVTGFEY